MKKLAMITVILLVAVMTFSFSDDLYRMLTRYPEKVEKTSFDFKGEVLQWEERNHYNIYRIATKPT
ncbi:MAG: hypothetical protein PWQ84_1606 [Thermotogaceae bacterium]|nr:hypothetical protein [Thermotogaceae bacterium]